MALIQHVVREQFVFAGGRDCQPASRQKHELLPLPFPLELDDFMFSSPICRMNSEPTSTRAMNAGPPFSASLTSMPLVVLPSSISFCKENRTNFRAVCVWKTVPTRTSHSPNVTTFAPEMRSRSRRNVRSCGIMVKPSLPDHHASNHSANECCCRNDVKITSTYYVHWSTNIFF